MKAVGGLFDQIATFQNVAMASWRAAQGKRNRWEVRAFFAQFETNVNRITRELADGLFRFSGYQAFSVRDPKTRVIHAPPFRDRVVHHAMIGILGPTFEKGSISQSYACRAGKGQHASIDRVRSWLQRRDAFLKMDVAKYYDSISHARLKEALERRFRERKVLALFTWLLASYEHHPGHGLPIGALTSQYLGNFFLQPVDHWVQEHLGVARYCRYMDDMLLLGDPYSLRGFRRRILERLDDMGLEIKEGGILNNASMGVPWLGFTLYPDRKRLNAQGRRRLRRRLHSLEQADIPELERQSRATALFAHAVHADDLAWRRMVCNFRDTQGTESRGSRRLLEQRRQEVPVGLPEQEASAQPEQESGLSCPVVRPRHGGDDSSPDDACSRAPTATAVGDKTKGKSLPPAESCVWTDATKASGGAPLDWTDEP